ncbi:MAG: ATP-dependent DNA helicase RecG [Muribaculaceae bacterium]|nr:ATP-dependent DNA helicase RecG [Muribaculaceae bacterium]
MNRIANNDIKYLTGVGPKRAELLASELKIHTFYDLLYYFPFRYVDRSSIYKIGNLTGCDVPYVQLKGHFINFTENGEGARKRLNALFTDGSGIIEVVWFNRVKSIKQNYSPGVEYILFGKPTLYNGRYSLAHPEIELSKPTMLQRGLQGVYNITEKLRNRSISSRTIQQLVENMLKILPTDLNETLPPHIIAENHLMPLREALINIHKPVSLQHLSQAQQRLKFDELFYLQLNILRYTKQRTLNISGHKFNVVGTPFNDFYNNHLPFPLTGAQKRVIKEMRHDMGSGRQMNRLLQGDVGSGKTLVAFMTMLIAIGNGYQTCIMAPTEILASQHYETISKLAKGIGVKVALLTGSTRKKEREILHSQLQSGELQILIGTHAVIEDTVIFHNLGLVVIDEQHRFGVAQRAKLWKKNATTPPHVLVMTATPIPRTLAMTVYGDLDVSIIDELPPGRKPVHTMLQFDTHRESVNRFMGEQIKLGRQIYIVYPLIHESETLDLKNLEEGYEYICDVFPNRRVCFVHGQMKPAEKEHQMQLFASGAAEIMVATTVIEVGVNVPNASVMIIENAERFGLSQLHQLRGRVGRGADQSYCILMSHPKMSADTRKRLQIMTETNDGFEVAEADMKLRGPGDLEGTQQSGLAFDLKISNLARDGQIVQQAREIASRIIENDPTLSNPENRILNQNLKALFSRTINWSLIS